LGISKWSLVKVKRTITLLVFLLLPLLAGITLTYLSEGWATKIVPPPTAQSPLQFQDGFPFYWRVVEWFPCPPSPRLIEGPCGLAILANWAGLALDWAFYSSFGYALVGMIAFAQRRRLKGGGAGAKYGSGKTSRVKPGSVFGLSTGGCLHFAVSASGGWRVQLQ
jgi:hypothetical protein